METKNKSKKIFFAVFLLVTLTGFGTLGIYGGHDNRHVYAQEDNSNASFEDLQEQAQDNPDGSGGIFAWLGDYISSNFAKILLNLVLFVPNMAIQAVLKILLVLALGLLTVAEKGFQEAVNPAVLTGVLSHGTIYHVWGIVRDLLNIFFILALLFSAFCTIFQVEKFGIKNIVWKVVISALLVNFSFPITRFIIDLSNMMMYYIANATGFSQKGWVVFSNSGPIANLRDYAFTSISVTDLGHQIMILIFFFSLALPLLVVAMLFWIRTIMFAILIMFSPIAFVGSIFPFLSGYASEWWKALFKYCFFGPVMMFMLYVSLKMMDAVNETIEPLKETSLSLKEYFSEFFLLLSLPIILLWMSIIIAQKAQIIGADTATKYAKNAVKWGSVGAVAWASKKSGLTEGVKQRYQQFKQTGPLGTERTAQRGAQVAALLGTKGSVEKDMQIRKEEYKKEHLTKEEKNTRASEGDSAAALLLAEDGDFEVSDKRNTYKEFMSKNKDDNIKKIIEGKTKAKRIDVVIDYKMENESEARAVKLANGAPITDAIRKDAKLQIAKEEYGKIAPGKIKEQNMAALVGYDEKSQSVSLKENDVARRKAIEDIHLKHIESGNFEKITADMDANKFSAARSVGVL